MAMATWQFVFETCLINQEEIVVPKHDLCGMLGLTSSGTCSLQMKNVPSDCRGSFLNFFGGIRLDEVFLFVETVLDF